MHHVQLPDIFLVLDVFLCQLEFLLIAHRQRFIQYVQLVLVCSDLSLKTYDLLLLAIEHLHNLLLFICLLLDSVLHNKFVFLEPTLEL
jgi:hypothetical protein